MTPARRDLRAKLLEHRRLGRLLDVVQPELAKLLRDHPDLAEPAAALFEQIAHDVRSRTREAQDCEA